MQNIRQKQEMKWAVAQTPKNAQKFKSDKKAEKLSWEDLHDIFNSINNFKRML